MPGRAAMLRSMAVALEARREELLTVERETGLGAGPLGGELTRTRYQLELFADIA